MGIYRPIKLLVFLVKQEHPLFFQVSALVRFNSRYFFLSPWIYTLRTSSLTIFLCCFLLPSALNTPPAKLHTNPMIIKVVIIFSSDIIKILLGFYSIIYPVFFVKRNTHCISSECPKDNKNMKLYFIT